MAESVPEALTLAGRLDPLAGEGVDAAARGAGAHLAQRGHLGLEDEVVDVGGVVRQRARGERPRAVRAVPVDHAAEVHHHQLAVGDDAIPWARMRERAVRGAGHDRGKRWLRAARPHAVLELQGDVALGTPRQPPLDQLPQHLVRKPRGLAYTPELLRPLYRPQPLDQASRGNQPGPLRDELPQPLVRANREGVAPDPHPSPREALGGVLGPGLAPLAALGTAARFLPGRAHVPEGRAGGTAP